MRNAIRSISITKSVDRRKGEMAGDNPYLEDWERIRHIAASISEREERVRELRGQAYELESRISGLSYEPDDDGNDRNGSARSYYYDRLYGIQSEISYTEGLISSARDEAHGMAGSFRQRAGEYGQRAAHTSNAGSGFQSLEGFRFGASSARAGAALAGQRTTHYEDHAAALNELASAAEEAAGGYFSGAGYSAVRGRGEYRRQGPDISGGGDGRSKENAYPEEAEVKRGGSYRNIAADAGLARLGAKGVFNRDGGLEFSKVAHGSVGGKGGELSVEEADEALAAEWGITADMLREYRNENGLVWVNDQGTAELVPGSIAGEYAGKSFITDNVPKTSSGLLLASTVEKPVVLVRDKEENIAAGMRAIDQQMDILIDDLHDKGIYDQAVIDKVLREKRDQAECLLYDDVYGKVEEQCIRSLNSMKIYFDERNWSRMDINERDDALNTLAVNAGCAFRMEIQGVRFFDKSSIHRGYYSGDGYLYLNADVLKDTKKLPDALDTIFHEGRHAFQRKAVENPNLCSVQREQAAIWEKNFANYIRYEKNPRGYALQPVETDARYFAEEILRGREQDDGL